MIKVDTVSDTLLNHRQLYVLQTQWHADILHVVHNGISGWNNGKFDCSLVKSTFGCQIKQNKDSLCDLWRTTTDLTNQLRETKQFNQVQCSILSWGPRGPSLKALCRSTESNATFATICGYCSGYQISKLLVTTFCLFVKAQSIYFCHKHEYKAFTERMNKLQEMGNDPSTSFTSPVFSVAWRSLKKNWKGKKDKTNKT